MWGMPMKEVTFEALDSKNKKGKFIVTRFDEEDTSIPYVKITLKSDKDSEMSVTIVCAKRLIEALEYVIRI